MTNHGTVDVQVKVGSKENVPLMKDRQKKGDKVLAFLRTVSGMLAHAVAVGFTFYIVYIAQPGSSKFKLMTVAVSAGRRRLPVCDQNISKRWLATVCNTNQLGNDLVIIQFIVV